MADKLGEIFVEIKAKTDSLEKEMKTLKGKLDKDAKKMGNSFGSMFGKIAVGGGVLIALRKAFDLSGVAKDFARDAKEIESKFDTVFSSITTKANKMADNFAKSFGVAGSTARELLGDTGDLLVGFGFTEDKALELSNSVNSLAQDLASFTNYSGGAKGASAALTKALLGETESAKSLGIVIRQNTKEFRNEVQQLSASQGITTQQAKAMVILKQAYTQSSKAVGDYARTKDSLANVERRSEEQTKKLLEVFGKGLIPAYKLYNNLLSATLKFLTPVEDAFKSATEKASEQRVQFEQLAGTYLNLKEKIELTKAEQKLMQETIGSLQREYPNYLGNINLEKAGYDEAKTAIKGAREELDKYLVSMVKKGAIQANEDKFIELGKRAYEITAQRIKAEEKLKSLTENQKNKKPSVFGAGENRIGRGLGVDNQASEGELLQSEIDTQNRLLSELDSQTSELRAETQRVMTELEKTIGLVIAPKPDGGTGGSGGDNIVKQYTEALKQISALGPESMKSPGFESPSELETKTLPIDPVAFEESTAQIVETWAKSTELMETSFNEVTDGIAQSMHELIHIRIAKDASDLERIWANVANAIIYQIQQIIAKWAVLNVLSFALGGGGIGLKSVIGAASGGTFQAGSTGITKMASGGSFVVPSGHPTDTYPLLLRSGEEATITPSHKVGNGGNNDKLLTNMQQQQSVQNSNLIGALDSLVRITAAKELRSKITNQGIVLSYEKGSRQKKRLS